MFFPGLRVGGQVQGEEVAVRTVECGVARLRERPRAAAASQIRHDIRHELATIALLAEVVGSSPELTKQTRDRVEQLTHEAQWLDELLDAYDDAAVDPQEWSPPVDAVRLDLLTAEVITGLHLVSLTNVTLNAARVCVRANRLASWRALRNVIENAFRAAGPNGQLRVGVGQEAAMAVVQIDDDGPGFGNGPAGIASQGLRIVQEYVAERGGVVEIRASELGGCCVRLLIPALAG